MKIHRYAAFGTLLGAAALVGCDESAMDEVQSEREDVVEQEQELREEQAELRDAQREAQRDGYSTPSAAEHSDPEIVVPNVDALPAPEEGETTEPAGGALLPSTPAGPEGGTPTPPALPNEGDPDAGTDTTDPGNTAGEAASPAEPVPAEEPDSADEETESTEPEPVSPQ